MAQAETCPTFKSGDLIKVTGRPAIYAVDSNGKVLYFPSGDEFKSWNSNDSYGGYTAISQACYDALPVPSMAPMGVNFRPGSYVVKRISSDQLYVIEPNNTLAKVTSEVAKALYGTTYKARTVADVFWNSYTNRAADLTEAKAHPGMLISNGGKTYFVNTDGSLSQVSATGFTANRFKQAFVRPVASIAGFTMGAEIAAEDGKTSDRTQTGGVVATIPGGTVSGGSVSVGLAIDNPAAGLLASGTAFNKVLKVTLTAGSADVAVTGLTLKKSGFAANSAINGADVVDASGVRHGNVSGSIDTDNNLTLLFSGSPIVVKANSSQTVTVRVNIAASGTTGTMQFSLAGSGSVTTNGGSVSGSFPVTGNVFTLQDGSNAIAAVALNEQPVNASGATLNVDSNNEQEIAKFSINETSSRENVQLSSLTLYNNGTSADTDIQDVQLVGQDGTVLATAQQLNKTVVFSLVPAYNIDKGVTKNFTVRAKIVNGAARTIQFVVYNDYDAILVGGNTGANILPTTTSGGTAGTGTTFPVGNKTSYNLVTIGSGSISFNKDTSSPSSAISPGTNGVVIAKFFAKPTGENMELRQISLNIVTSTPSLLTGSVVVKVNGASVWSGSPALFAGAALTETLSSYPVLTAGQNSYITVESNVMSGAASGETVYAAMDLVQVKRLVTNDIVDPGTNSSQGNTLAVQAAALKVTTMATPVAQSVVAGSAGVVLANIELNAGTVSSGEDVRVSKIVISDVWSGTLTDIGNLALYDANGNQIVTTASTATNAASSSFNLANPITVPKAGAVTLTLKGDVLTGTTSTHKFSVASIADVTATGISTGNSLSSTITGGVGSGQLLSVTGSGTLSLSTVSGGSASPSNDQTVLVGQTAVPVFAVKLTAQNEPIKITSFKITATGTIGTSNDIVNLKLYRDNDTAPFASAGQMNYVSANNYTYTWTATDNLLPAAVQPGTPVTIYVKADVGAQGNVVIGDSFRFAFATNTDIGAKGASSGQTLVNASIVGTPAVTAFTSIVPFSVSLAAQAPTGNQTQSIVAGTQLAIVKITNNGGSKITVTGVKFTDNGTHSGSTTTYKLYYSDLNSVNFVGNTASSTWTSVDFSNLTASSTGTGPFTIDGGAYRYVTVAINTLGSAVSGDNFQLSIASLGDVKYSVVGSDLGYSVDASGNLATVATGLKADGKPSLATLSKQ
jgi:hypothetical protein